MIIDDWGLVEGDGGVGVLHRMEERSVDSYTERTLVLRYLASVRCISTLLTEGACRARMMGVGLLRMRVYMVAKDNIHQAVKNALIKDGWTITHDPFTIEFEEEYLYADLAAERVFVAKKDARKIVVECKSFLGRSIIQDFKSALGQYRMYLQILAQTNPDYELYLAIGEDTYHSDFQRKVIQFIILIKFHS